MFGFILENTIEKTFSTCYSYFLTFSQLPNEYIISFIPKNTNKTQKISHFLGEIVIEIGVISPLDRTQSPLSLPSSLNLTEFDEFFCLGFVSFVFLCLEIILYIHLEAEKM